MAHFARSFTARHAFGVIACLALALVLSAIALAPIREQRLLVGRPGDARAVDGVSLPSDYLGARGRWTRGDARVMLPAYPAPSLVSLRVAPPDDRIPDSVEIIVNGLRSQRATLAAGWNAIAVTTDGSTSAASATAGVETTDALTVQVRSAVTRAAAGPPRGVFIEQATLRTGGLAALRHTSVQTWALLSLAFLGVIAMSLRLTRGAASSSDLPSSDLTSRDGRVGRAVAVGTLVLLACAGAIAFRIAVLTHLPMVTVVCWTAAFAMLLADSRPAAWLAASSTRRVALAFTLGSVLLIALLFPDAILHGRVLSQADMFFEFGPWNGHAPAGYRAFDRPPLGDVPMIVYPFSVFTRTRWWDGVFPLWTSAISAGQPFLATYHSALFSPFTAILAAVPLPHATVAIAVARMLVSGLGMFLFLRALGLSRWAASFGGVAFLLNPFSLIALEHPIASALPWLPWILLAGERLGAHRARSLVWLAVTTMLAMVGGHPHGGLFVVMLGGGYALARACTAPDRVRAVLTAGVALALGAGLAAVQIVPFFEYLSLSRAVTLRNNFPLNPYFAPASTLITALVPNFLGHHGAGNFAGPTNYLEQQTYAGIAVWLLAAVGLAGGLRQWRAWFFALAATLAMLVMYAAPGIHQIISALPLIRAASLPRVAIVTLGSLSVLAAFGVEQILNAAGDRRGARRTGVTLTLAAGIVIALVLAVLRQRAAFLDAQALLDFATRWTWVAVWFACAVLLVCLARVAGWIGRSGAGVALTGLLALDLLLFGRGFHDTLPPEQVFPVVPEIAAVQRDPGLFRVLGLGQSMLPNAAMVYGLQDIRGTDGLTVARYADLLDVILRDQGFSHIAERVSSPLINLLNVKYVFGASNIPAPEDGWFTKIIDGETPVYRNNRVLPRAFLVDSYIVRDGNPARRTLRDGLVDFRRVTLLEQEPAEGERPVPASSADGVGTATLAGYRDQQVEIDTEAPGRRLLVLTDVHYPGWHVSIDGQPATLYRANFAFRAVSVPEGRHRVAFTYRPASVRLGFALSSLAAVSLAGLALVERRRAARLAVTVPRSSTPPEPSPAAG